MDVQKINEGYYRAHGRAFLESTDWGYSIPGTTEDEAIKNLHGTLKRLRVIK